MIRPLVVFNYRKSGETNRALVMPDSKVAQVEQMLRLKD